MAREAAENALRLNSDHVFARLNRAQLMLLHGDFLNGFAEHEWRLKRTDYRQNFSIPFWKGEYCPNSTIILWAEQGHGDAIQFVRYAQLVRARMGRVIVSCRQSLARLFAQVNGVDEVITENETFNADYHAPLMEHPIFSKRSWIRFLLKFHT